MYMDFPDFPGGSDGKASAYNVGDLGSIPGSFPWRRKWQPTPVFLPGKSHGWRSLVGYSSWGRKESDTTEQLDSLTHSLLVGTSLRMNRAAVLQLSCTFAGRTHQQCDRWSEHLKVVGIL